MFRWLHHIASFFLLVAAILLLVVSVSSPVGNDIGFLNVDLSNTRTNTGSKLVFGNWGFCITIPHQDDQCTKSHLGYDPIGEVVTLNAASSSDFSGSTQGEVRRLTKAFVLHPIACGLSVFAFILGVGASFVGSFCAALAAALSCAVTLVAMAIDFWLFGRVKSGINDHNNPSTAHWGSCIWLCMVAFLLSFIGMVLMLLTCCTRDKSGGSPRTSRRSRFGSKV